MTGPIMVAPVEQNGIRYEALHWGKERDLGQNGGFVVALDDDTGVELWVQKIYHITYGDKSPQKYDRFVTKLVLIENGGALAVSDDTGAVHRLDLTTRAVTLLQAAPEVEPPINPRKPEPEGGKGLLKRLFGG